MIVYRIGKTRYARDLTGEGSRLHGGRWNNKLTPCIYTSESRALALLEYTVNVNADDIPRALSITSFEIPDDRILVLAEAGLPGNWKQAAAPSSTKNFGDQLLKAAKNLIIRIPSAVIPEEYNYLLNPAHPGIKNCKITATADFVYDIRIKLV
jgi:RES domain-containing protein